MEIVTKLNLGSKVYLNGVKEHLGHIEAVIVEIRLTAAGIVYIWEQQINKKLWDTGEFNESDIGIHIWDNLTDWIVANQQELIDLGLVDKFS